MSTPWVQKKNREGKKECEVLEARLFKRPDVITKRFLNIVTILGLARTGKSTLMNSVHKKEVFETSDELQGCTVGAWVSDSVIEIDGGGVAIFVDTEGQGNESKQNDYELLMPIVLLSKVIIFNIMRKFAVRDVLEELAFLVKLGEKIKTKRGKAKFGHLIIAVRDYDLKKSAEELHDHFFKYEDGKDDGVKMRNKIRNGILETFGQPKVIPFPSKKDVNKVSDFEGKVKEFREAISENITSPHQIHGNTFLTPGNVNGFMKEMMAQAKHGCLDVGSVVELMEQRKIDEARSRFEKDFIKQCDDLKLPMSKEKLRNKITAIKEELLEKIKEETSGVIFKREECDKAIKELKNFFDQRITAKENENELLACKAQRGKTLQAVADTAAVCARIAVSALTVTAATSAAVVTAAAGAAAVTVAGSAAVTARAVASFIENVDVVLLHAAGRADINSDFSTGGSLIIRCIFSIALKAVLQRR